MAPMTIRDLVLQAEQLAEEEQRDELERTPFAEVPWDAGSEVIWRDGDQTAPINSDGKRFEYFLEPAVIAELKEGLDSADADRLVARVIRYARDDA